MPTPRNHELVPLAVVTLGTGMIAIAVALYLNGDGAHTLRDVALFLFGAGLIVAARWLIKRAKAPYE